MRVGMSASDFESKFGVEREGDEVLFHVKGMDFPARYEYEVDGSPIDPLISFLRVRMRGGVVASIEFFVEPTVNT